MALSRESMQSKCDFHAATCGGFKNANQHRERIGARRGRGGNRSAMGSTKMPGSLSVRQKPVCEANHESKLMIFMILGRQLRERVLS
jgi:hypothetical protein